MKTILILLLCVSFTLAQGRRVRGVDFTGSAKDTISAVIVDFWDDEKMVYIPEGDDIQTYINAADSGNTIVLGSGVYTITDTIEIDKPLNIRGQGKTGFVTTTVTPTAGTLISSSTASVIGFYIKSDNVRISDLSMNITGSNSKGIETENNHVGIVFNDIDIIVNSTGNLTDLDLKGCNVVMRDITFYVASSTGTAAGCFVSNNSETTQDIVVDAYNVTGTAIGAATFAFSFVAWNIADDNTITLNLSNSICRGIGGTPLDIGVGSISTITNNSTVNAEFCTIDGGDYDFYQTGTNVLNVGGSLLKNSTTFGTVTFRSTLGTQNIAVSDSASIDTLTVSGIALVGSDTVMTNANLDSWFGSDRVPVNIKGLAFFIDDTTDLKALTDTNRVYLKGLSSANTLGGGEFLYKASGYTADGGIVFDHVTSGYWVRKDALEYGYLMPEWYGVTESGDRSTEMQAMFTASVTNRYDIKFGRRKTYQLNTQVTADYDCPVKVDFNGSTILIGAHLDHANGILYVRGDSGNVEVCNGVIDAQDNAHSVLRLTAESENTNIIWRNFVIRDLFYATGDAATMRGIYFFSYGGNLNVKNIVFDGIDSDVGKSGTVGLSCGSTGYSFANMKIENIVGYDITEQGGTSTDNSDLIMIDGWYTADNDTLHTLVDIENITLKNLSCDLKRVIKIQHTSLFTIDGVNVHLENSDMYAVVGSQDGSGTVENIHVTARGSDVGAIVQGGLLTAQAGLQDAHEFIRIQGVTCVFDDTSGSDMVTFARFNSSDSKYDINIENVHILNVDSLQYGFIDIEELADSSFINFKNITVDGTGVCDALIESDIAINVYHTGTIENVRILDGCPIMARTRGDYFYVPSKITNSNVHWDFTNAGDDSARWAFHRYPESIGGTYFYSASTTQNDSTEKTVIELPWIDNVSNEIAQSARLDFEFLRGYYDDSYSRVKFVCVYRDDDDDVAVLLEEYIHYAGTDTALHDPEVSWNAATNKVTVHFDTCYAGGYNSTSMYIRANTFFEVDTVMGYPTIP